MESILTKYPQLEHLDTSIILSLKEIKDGIVIRYPFENTVTKLKLINSLYKLTINNKVYTIKNTTIFKEFLKEFGLIKYVDSEFASITIHNIKVQRYQILSIIDKIKKSISISDKLIEIPYSGIAKQRFIEKLKSTGIKSNHINKFIDILKKYNACIFGTFIKSVINTKLVNDIRRAPFSKIKIITEHQDELCKDLNELLNCETLKTKTFMGAINCSACYLTDPTDRYGYHILVVKGNPNIFKSEYLTWFTCTFNGRSFKWLNSTLDSTKVHLNFNKNGEYNIDNLFVNVKYATQHAGLPIEGSGFYDEMKYNQKYIVNGVVQIDTTISKLTQLFDKVNHAVDPKLQKLKKLKNALYELELACQEIISK